MTTVLAILGWTLFSLAIVAGLALNLVGLFGNWIILGAIAIAWAATDHFTLGGLVIMLLFAAVGEVLEFFASAFGATRFGGGKGASAAAMVGCLAGAVLGSPILPIVGTLIGAVAGAFIAAVLYEYIQMEKQMNVAFRTGMGAAIGRIAGMFAKFFMGLLILAAAAWTF
jgi:hypothetical protein